MLILGIDEAGRGPVLGPLVMAGALLREEDVVSLKELGVKDSKLLSPEKRETLEKEIHKIAVNFTLEIVEPLNIDAAIKSWLNLNWLEGNMAVAIINRLKPDTAIIDCPSPNIQAYKEYLFHRLENKKIKLIVEHKADLNHLPVSAASILAKVARDREIEKMKQKIGFDFGSGYLTDEKTQVFLKKHFNDYENVFRKAWVSFRNVENERQQKSLGEF